MLGKYRLTGRDAAFATELASGTIRRQGTYDAILAACTDRPLASTAAKVLDVLRLGLPPAARDAGRAARGDQHQRRPGPLRGRARAPPGSPTPCCAGCRPTISRPGSPGSTPTGRPASPTRSGSSTRSARPSADDEIDALLAADNDPPAVTLVARPGRATPDELPGEPTPFSPYGVVSAGGDPGAVPAVAEGRAGVQDEGSQLVAHGPRRRPDRRAPTTAGSTCVPARAARPPCSRPSRLIAAPGSWPNEHQPHRADLVRRALDRRRGRRGGDRRGRHGPAVARGLVRPGARRRAVHRPRRPAAPAGGTLAPPAGRPARPGPAPARPRSTARARPGPPRRGGPLRHLLAGPRRDPRRPRVGAGQAATT